MLCTPAKHRTSAGSNQTLITTIDNCLLDCSKDVQLGCPLVTLFCKTIDHKMRLYPHLKKKIPLEKHFCSKTAVRNSSSLEMLKNMALSLMVCSTVSEQNAEPYSHRFFLSLRVALWPSLLKVRVSTEVF